MRNLGIIVQAHMGSTRLPNKMLKDLSGKTVLGHVICRLKQVKNADTLLVATSNLPIDNAIVAECKKYKVSFFRGSDNDVLSRFYYAAQEYNLSDIARVCADNTLVDPEIIDRELTLYREGCYDVIKCDNTVPLGLGCEVFSFASLKDAFENGHEHYHREHVTPYIYEKAIKVGTVGCEKDYSKYRFTLDTEEDWNLIKNIYNSLYYGEDNITLQQVVNLMAEHPDWFDINKNVHQKSIKD